MRLLLYLHLSLLAALMVGCGARSGIEEPPSSPEKEKTSAAEGEPVTAHVVCDGDGVSVLTSKVEARSDGMHLSIENRLEGSADLSVDHSGGGMGWSVPAGESERVANVPPGKVQISCFSPSWGRDKLFAMKAEEIEVLVGNSGYRSTKLDCPRERSGRIKPYTKEEMEEQKGDPVEIFRRANSDSLRENDVVEVAGNTLSRDERTVRVVRDGEVVATAHYLKFSAGWLKATDENCAKF